PHLGSLVARELGTAEGGLPGCITIGSDSKVGSGYLAPEFAPLLVEKIENPLEDLKLVRGVNKFRLEDREGLLDAQNKGFAKDHDDARLGLQRDAYTRALSLIRSSHLRAFDISE